MTSRPSAQIQPGLRGWPPRLASEAGLRGWAPRLGWVCKERRTQRPKEGSVPESTALGCTCCVARDVSRKGRSLSPAGGVAGREREHTGLGIRRPGRPVVAPRSSPHCTGSFKCFSFSSLSVRPG